MYPDDNIIKNIFFFLPTLKFNSKPIGFPASGLPPILGHIVYEPGRDV